MCSPPDSSPPTVPWYVARSDAETVGAGSRSRIRFGRLWDAEEDTAHTGDGARCERQRGDPVVVAEEAPACEPAADRVREAGTRRS